MNCRLVGWTIAVAVGVKSVGDWRLLGNGRVCVCQGRVQQVGEDAVVIHRSAAIVSSDDVPCNIWLLLALLTRCIHLFLDSMTT